MAIPVSLADAKVQLRLETDDVSRDVEVSGYIADAAGWVEKYTGHILVARDVTEQFRGFEAVNLRAWPVKPAAVVGVAYLDASGAPIEITGAVVDTTSRPARVRLGGGIFWPFRDALQLFTVTVRAGYEPADEVPRNFRRAMLVMISAYDSDREGGELLQTAEASARRLCRDYRLRRL
jgi:uncharacterized phiE125 gp8 family phage protein